MATAAADLRAPYPWMGGKRRIAAEVWRRFGDVRNLVDPFFGSGAILLERPQPFEGTETCNDLNGWLTNFWRALQHDPDGVAKSADYPVSELDLHARGDWLFYRPGVDEWIEQLRGDPDFYDVKSAGWWVYGQCSWIGTGWDANRKRPHLNAGRGVNRQLPHLGDAGRGVGREPPTPPPRRRGEGREEDTPPFETSRTLALREYLRGLAERMRNVRICCGDWSRVCGPTPTVKMGLTAVFLDPPYAVKDRADCYGEHEDREVSAAVREWAIEQGTDPMMRLALCGYEGEHEMPSDWECLAWKAHGGYSTQRKDGVNNNRHRERVWFSPHCLRVTKQKEMFKEEE